MRQMLTALTLGAALALSASAAFAESGLHDFTPAGSTQVAQTGRQSEAGSAGSRIMPTINDQRGDNYDTRR